MSDLISEPLVSQKPNRVWELYEQMTATAVDFRATGVSDDWHQELWELAQMARERLEPTPRMRPGALNDLMPTVFAAIDRMGLHFKSESKMASDEREKQYAIQKMHTRLRRIRDNAWLVGSLSQLDRETYLAQRQEYAETLTRRLEVLDARLPGHEEAEQAARDYINAMDFWQTLERQSTRRERREALKALTGMQYHYRRTERCYEHRDRAIFLWEEPPPDPGPEEKDEIREAILQEIRELSNADPQV